MTPVLGAGVLLFAAVSLHANESVPASTNVRGSDYPRIQSDGRITFRLKAPDARTVQLQTLSDALGKGPIDFRRDDAGVWTLTVAPVRPGFHYYAFIVDGVQVNDPGSRTFFGWGRESSGVEVPGKGVDFYNLTDVPHGDVHIHVYRSVAQGEFRTAYVYTPPGYDANRTKRYPVLYLQHGAGESERAWTQQGRANLILDNLIAAKKCKPMIVVMENGYPNGTAFEKLVADELVWNIDSSYRTLADKNNRAIAGLSMGAGEAVSTGLKHTDLFAYVGAMSGGTQATASLAATPPLKLFWLGFGTEDRGYAAAKKAHDDLLSKKVAHVWFEATGTHEWQVWRQCLYELAQRLF